MKRRQIRVQICICCDITIAPVRKASKKLTTKASWPHDQLRILLSEAGIRRAGWAAHAWCAELLKTIFPTQHICAGQSSAIGRALLL